MLSTKIICTIGPASDSAENLAELAAAGMNVARLNFSHGNHQSHLNIINQIRKLNLVRKFPVALLLDTQGPEIRTGDQVVTLISGKRVKVKTPPDVETAGSLFVNYHDLQKDLVPGNIISLDSGLMSLKFLEKNENGLECEVIDGGVVKARRHVNLPGTVVNLPGITAVDKQDILFGVEQNVDIIALSFVRSSETILEVRDLLGDKVQNIQIIAKIENQEGVDRLEEIVRVADGVMVARGDLGIEVELEDVPQIQRKIAFLCAKYGKRLIVATQMLESMIKNPVPTRAEVTDVANAVFEQADAIMLSGETSVGKYPVRAVDTLVKIAGKTEKFPGVNFSEKLLKKSHGQFLAESAIQIASKLKIRAIVVITRNGRGAAYLSNMRPRQIGLYSFTNDPKVVSSMTLFRSVFPFLMEFRENPEDTIQDALRFLSKNEGFEATEQVVVLANILTGEGFRTSLQIRSIPAA
ncbi:MAG: pyruvate kinase [SAR324 cluster bacterium]|nr:pyruvate kinase [SAR324 cluster bacterium]MBL7035180.1 pyruvate kinase [SAR324 cluster bacterium]